MGDKLEFISLFSTAPSLPHPLVFQTRKLRPCKGSQPQSQDSGGQLSILKILDNNSVLESDKPFLIQLWTVIVIKDDAEKYVSQSL